MEYRGAYIYLCSGRLQLNLQIEVQTCRLILNLVRISLEKFKSQKQQGNEKNYSMLNKKFKKIGLYNSVRRQVVIRKKVLNSKPC